MSVCQMCSVSIAGHRSSLDKTLDEKSSKTVISMLREVKSGVIAMSEDIKGLVESSENLGIVRLNEDTFSFTVSKEIYSVLSNHLRLYIPFLNTALPKKLQ